VQPVGPATTFRRLRGTATRGIRTHATPAHAQRHPGSLPGPHPPAVDLLTRPRPRAASAHPCRPRPGAKGQGPRAKKRASWRRPLANPDRARRDLAVHGPPRRRTAPRREIPYGGVTADATSPICPPSSGCRRRHAGRTTVHSWRRLVESVGAAAGAATGSAGPSGLRTSVPARPPGLQGCGCGRQGLLLAGPRVWTGRPQPGRTAAARRLARGGAVPTGGIGDSCSCRVRRRGGVGVFGWAVSW
jgi:hypothetical protein